MKKKKGFTLVELCVVMAICAIVGTMVSTFMILATKQKNELTTEANCVNEINEVQKSINDWIRKYDSTEYKITVESSSKKLVAKNSSNKTVSKLYIYNEKLSEEANGSKTGTTETLKYIKSLTYKIPTYTNENAENVSDKVIRVTVTYSDGNKQTLLFSLFSNTTRQRKVEGR